MLGPERLDQLVTTHGIKIGALTGGDNPDSTQAADTQLKVYVVPIDGDGTPIKAAGSFIVEVFDLGDPKFPLIGTWKFDEAHSKDLFYSQLGLYTYVLTCPWQKIPMHPNLTVRVKFDDALTGREFAGQAQATARLR